MAYGDRLNLDFSPSHVCRKMIERRLRYEKGDWGEEEEEEMGNDWLKILDTGETICRSRHNLEYPQSKGVKKASPSSLTAVVFLYILYLRRSTAQQLRTRCYIIYNETIISKFMFELMESCIDTCTVSQCRRLPATLQHLTLWPVALLDLRFASQFLL